MPKTGFCTGIDSSEMVNTLKC